jgi:protein-disulfide isomerase
MTAKATRHIPGTVTEVDPPTGAEVHKPMAWNLMPPPTGRCQICAAAHAAEEPHDASSLYYQMAFKGMVGRDPTWADAIAHCSDEMKAAWKHELRKLNAWTEPPAGEAPIAHHGVD